MPTIHLKSGNAESIIYKEKLGCGDEYMILVRNYSGKEFRIPKNNIAYIEE